MLDNFQAKTFALGVFHENHSPSCEVISVSEPKQIVVVIKYDYCGEEKESVITPSIYEYYFRTYPELRPDTFAYPLGDIENDVLADK